MPTPHRINGDPAADGTAAVQLGTARPDATYAATNASRSSNTCANLTGVTPAARTGSVHGNACSLADLRSVSVGETPGERRDQAVHPLRRLEQDGTAILNCLLAVERRDEGLVEQIGTQGQFVVSCQASRRGLRRS